MPTPYLRCPSLGTRAGPQVSTINTNGGRAEKPDDLSIYPTQTEPPERCRGGVMVHLYRWFLSISFAAVQRIHQSAAGGRLAPVLRADMKVQEAPPGSEDQDPTRVQRAIWDTVVSSSVICDKEWHYYVINVEFPVVSLYMDGATYEPYLVTNDWPIHPSHIDMQLTVGACWQGGEVSKPRFAQFFHGSLASLTIRPGKMESQKVISCLQACKEGLDINSLESLGQGIKWLLCSYVCVKDLDKALLHDCLLMVAHITGGCLVLCFMWCDTCGHAEEKSGLGSRPAGGGTPTNTPHQHPEPTDTPHQHSEPTDMPHQHPEPTDTPHQHPKAMLGQE
ncbi:Calsyntenin-2 [Galemys pyrenaicus]|uniref:Calsyntenin-2 n=1 Tax=Galemys pyrenaicus TaxID=202257 RepID=A0A8J6A325_GALPY|nr:Calsyntenin-2 [Galemys pyrenaicus]